MEKVESVSDYLKCFSLEKQNWQTSQCHCGQTHFGVSLYLPERQEHRKLLLRAGNEESQQWGLQMNTKHRTTGICSYLTEQPQNKKTDA